MLRKLLLYPPLFALFPVLSIAAHNIREIAVEIIYRPLLFSLLICLVLFIVMKLIFRDGARAGLITLLLLLGFFTYGQVYDKLEDLSPFGVALFRHRTMLPAYGITIGYLIFFVSRKLSNPSAPTFWLNILSIYLLIYPLFVISSSGFQQWLVDRNLQKSSAQVFVEAELPDVYYIILDAYARGDVLSKLGYDNVPFLDALRERGFYIAECSQSNYAYTEFSLSSSLNYDYLEVIDAHTHTDRIARLKHGAVRSFFELNGYEIVAFPTGWNTTEWTDADLYIEYGRPVTALTEFETLVANTTILRAVYDFRLFEQNNASRKDLRQLRALSLLDNVKKLPNVDGRLFVFAHLVLPHPPYSFGPNGEPSQFRGEGASAEETVAAYIDQVRFVNKEILKVVDALIMKSDELPVIIIQGDHGPPPELSPTDSEKLPILNAYFLPGKHAEEWLYPSISPVNTFRVVLNSYFGEDLSLLEDRSYYAPNENHEEYYLVPNSCSDEQ